MSSVALRPLGFAKHLFCYVTLGLLCGWYYFILLLVPLLLVLTIVYKSILSAVVLFLLFVLTVAPLDHRPRESFMYSWIWTYWREYFDLTADASSLDNQFLPGRKFMFFEFPHGVFPMGQFLSASMIRDLFPGQMICGTGADIVFMFPVMRQIMAWIGTRPAKRRNMSKILENGHHCAVIPGGIAEMYLVNKDTEEIFLKKRRNTVKVAIQEGADIVPVFFFGNTKLFEIAGKKGSNSLLARISRTLRMSLMFFYGRHYLPVPKRHPLHMASGEIVTVKKIEEPTEDDIDEVMNRLVASVSSLYENKKPEWEHRPLVIH